MIEFHIDGFLDLEKKFKNKQQMPTKVKSALTQCAMLVQRSAKMNIRANDSIVTGRLLNSITYDVHEDYALVGTNVFYSIFVEYGTGVRGDPSVAHTTRTDFAGQAPKPYLVPALKANQEQIKEILKNTVKGDKHG